MIEYVRTGTQAPLSMRLRLEFSGLGFCCCGVHDVAVDGEHLAPLGLPHVLLLLSYCS